MEIKSGWWVAAAMIIFLAALMWGFALGRAASIDDCRNVGAFVYEDVHVKCSIVDAPSAGQRGKDGA